MISLSIEQAKLETAGGGPLFQQSFVECEQHITTSWVTQVWENAQRFGVAIVETGVSIQKQRVGDVFLLDSWRNQGYGASQKRVLNECRMALGVLTLADMVTADGTRVLRSAFDGLSAGVLRSRGHPRMPAKLPRRHWLLWQEWIEGFTEDRHLRLRRRMQAWVREDREWTWWRDPDDDSVAWKRVGTEIQTWRRVQGRRARRSEFQATAEVRPAVPAGARRTSALGQGPLGVTLESLELQRMGETLPVHLRRDTNESTQYWERGCISGDATDAELRAALRRGDVLAVSDGSFKQGFGTSAYVLSVLDTGVQRTGRNVVPGASSVQSAYRSELAGVAGILRELLELEHGGDLGPGPVVIGLDGLRAMENCRDGVAQVHRPSFDLLDHIKALRQQLSIAVCFRWVKGHQDDGQEALDRWAVLNVHCDLEAKRHWSAMVTSTRPTWSGCGTFQWRLRVQSPKSSWSAADIHDDIVGRVVDRYWAKKMGPVQQACDSVAFQGRRKAYGRASWQQRLFVAKMSTGFIGVGDKLKQYGSEERCPWCGQAESVVHVVQCSASGQAWETCFQQYVDELELIGTSGPLVSQVFASLRSFSGRSVREGFREATPVRWWPVLMGWIPDDWCAQQQQWFEAYGTGRRFYTVEAWARDAILAGWRFVSGVWRCRNRAKSIAAKAQAEAQAAADALQEESERATGFAAWGRLDRAVAMQRLCGSGAGRSDSRAAWLGFVRAVREESGETDGGGAGQAIPGMAGTASPTGSRDADAPRGPNQWNGRMTPSPASGWAWLEIRQQVPTTMRQTAHAPAKGALARTRAAPAARVRTEHLWLGQWAVTAFTGGYKYEEGTGGSSARRRGRGRGIRGPAFARGGRGCL